MKIILFVLFIVTVLLGLYLYPVQVEINEEYDTLEDIREYDLPDHDVKG